MARTLMFKTPEAFQSRVDEFYAWCEANDKPLTMGRLCVFLGVTKETIRNYKNMPEYTHIIEDVRQMVEADMEERLQAGKGSAAGVIFSLKNNFGWKDQTEIKQDLNVTNHESALGELENALAAGITGAQDLAGQPDGLREDVPVH